MDSFFHKDFVEDVERICLDGDLQKLRWQVSQGSSDEVVANTCSEIESQFLDLRCAQASADHVRTSLNRKIKRQGTHVGALQERQNRNILHECDLNGNSHHLDQHTPNGLK